MNLYAFDDFDLGKCFLQMSKAPEWVSQEDLGWIDSMHCLLLSVGCWLLCLFYLFSGLTGNSIHSA